MTKKISLVILLVIFLFLRLYKLENAVNYSSEQGLFLAKSWEIIKEKKLTLIGPATSFKSQSSREFYQGPATYYLLAIPAALSPEPLVASYFLIFLNVIGLVLIFLKGGFFAAFLFACLPWFVTYSRFVWNPNFIPLFSALILFLAPGQFFLVGFFSGISLQFHYQSLLLIVGLLLWFAIRREKLKNYAKFAAGLALGFLPLLVFELRHDFYNLRTIFLILNTGGVKQLLPPPFYYFLCLSPFIVFYCGRLWQKLYQASKASALVLVLLILSLSVADVLSYIEVPPGMPKGLHYWQTRNFANIIASQGLENFNVANLLTGDTRAWDLRYLLLRSGVEPMDVDQYPNAQHLFVLSRYNITRTAQNPVWEISSFAGSGIKSWQIGDINMHLYSKQ